ncbi:S1 family peptidase [Pontibacter sp. MBLB2868]|uniref:S1 family peptidase n=1 Tax=Pontibacter sp. MBLB2868 TaxID=3451555 RepID=UPI003F74FDC9
MNIENISTQLLYTTFPIWAEMKDGSINSGTGFIYNSPMKGAENIFIPLLVTNYHVIKDSLKVYTEFVKSDGKSPQTGNKIRVELNSSMFSAFADVTNDLAVHPIAPIISGLERNNYKVFFRSLDPSIIPDEETIKKFSAMEEIIFIGYPSGLYDTENSFPIVRKGITATPVWNRFTNQEKFLIDAGVYPGSSGSPVFIYNQGSYATENGVTIGTRLFFLGVLSESIISSSNNKPNYFLGLGSVINTKCLLDFVNKTTEVLMSNNSIR